MAMLNNQRVSQFANYFWVGIALVSFDHRAPLKSPFLLVFWRHKMPNSANQPTGAHRPRSH